MSLRLAKLYADHGKKLSRDKILALLPPLEYKDGRTKQCHKDECNIEKIMARFDKSGTISHLAKYEGVYADFSDFDFHEQTTKLTQGREVFDALPAELRREFNQSPAAFFAYVNDPKNAKELRTKLPGLARPGQQLPRTASPDANLEAADAAIEKPEAPPPTDPLPVIKPQAE